MTEQRSFPSRIHVTGGSGAGKTTLAKRIGATLDLPVHHLDDIARDRQTGRARPAGDRMAAIQSIAAAPVWVTEGIHVGWTDPLCERAEVIVWLDEVRAGRAMYRIVRRFLMDGLRGLRRKPGVGCGRRLRGYVRHLGELVASMREVRGFHAGRPTEAAADGGSRPATVAQLEPFAAKVVHCRTARDVQRFMSTLQ